MAVDSPEEAASARTDELETPLLPEDKSASDSQQAQNWSQAPRNALASTLPSGPLPPISTARVHSDEEEIQRRPYTGPPTRHEIVIVRRGRMPPAVHCPHCNRQGPTIQYKTNGFCSCFTAGLLCTLGCCILAPFIFCCDTFKDTAHYCSHCRHFLGKTPA